MRLGIIGTGSVGTVLGHRWAELGHEIYFGSRNPAEAQSRLAQELARTVTVLPPHDAAGADIVILAVPGEVAADVVASLDDLEGRVLIDCTNPRSTGEISLGAQVAARAVGARVVKALNTLHVSALAEPYLADVRPVMPLCGDEVEARETVAELIRPLGLHPVDCGDLSAAGWLESMALLRGRLHQRGWGPEVAWSLVRVDDELDAHMMGRRQTRDVRRPVR